jgi:hypothetical protein
VTPCSVGRKVGAHVVTPCSVGRKVGAHVVTPCSVGRKVGAHLQGYTASQTVRPQWTLTDKHLT